jgi:hypothetical protein
MNKRFLSQLASAILISASFQAATPLVAQTRCNLTEATSPTVRGLHLGMNPQQFLALFPDLIKKKEMKDAIEKAKSTKSDEPVTIVVDPNTDADPHQFAGVVSVATTFYKGRAVDFNVEYTGATWTAVDEWIAKLSEAFQLPGAREWVVGPDEAPNKILKCNGILIVAAIQGGGSSIRVQNTTYLREVVERAREIEEMKRQQVKP